MLLPHHLRAAPAVLATPSLLDVFLVYASSFVFVGAPFYFPPLCWLLWFHTLPWLGLPSMTARLAAFAAAALLLWLTHRPMEASRRAFWFPSWSTYFSSTMVLDGVSCWQPVYTAAPAPATPAMVRDVPPNLDAAYGLNGRRVLYVVVPHGIYPYGMGLLLTEPFASYLASRKPMPQPEQQQQENQQQEQQQEKEKHGQQVEGAPGSLYLPRPIVATAALQYPVFGHLLAWTRAVPANAADIRRELAHPHARLVINPGGIAEIFHTDPVPAHYDRLPQPPSPVAACRRVSHRYRDRASTGDSSSSGSSSGSSANLAASDKCAAAAAGGGGASGGHEALLLKRRRGFISIAIQEQALLVPIFIFGHSQLLQLFRFVRLPVFERLSRLLRATFIFFRGRWGLPLPYHLRLLFAVGQPIDPAAVLPEQLAAAYQQRAFADVEGPGAKAHGKAAATAAAAAAATVAAPAPAAAPTPAQVQLEQAVDCVQGALISELRHLYYTYREEYDPAWKDRELCVE